MMSCQNPFLRMYETRQGLTIERTIHEITIQFLYEEIMPYDIYSLSVI
jgi:hypothetical protein